MITREQVIKVYELAMLDLPAGEVDEMVKKFQIIYNLAEHVLEVDTEGLEYMESSVTHASPLRKDEVEPSMDREEAMANTRDREFGYFRLKTVLPEEEENV